LRRFAAKGAAKEFGVVGDFERMRHLLPALVLTLAACGSPEPAPSGSPSAPPAQTASGDLDSAAQMQERIAELQAPYNEANYEAGRRVFAQCRSCHTIDDGAPHRVGPNLHGVFGREIGTAEGFNYSQAVQAADFEWDAAQLDHWLANPQTFLPGNRMAFAGVRDATQRRDLIAYLMVESEPEREDED
jgi:cytochrome c